MFKIINDGVDKKIKFFGYEIVLKNYKLLRYLKKNNLMKYKNIYFLLVNAGESYVISQYANKFAEDDTVFLVQHKYSLEIFKLFAPNVNVQLIGNSQLCYLLRSCGLTNISLKNCYVHILFPQSYWNDFWTKNPPMHFLEAFREFFNLENQQEFKFVLPEIKHNYYPKEINNENLIVLFTEAASLKTIDRVFWEKLVSELRKAGYNIFQNTCSKENYIQGCQVYCIDGVLKFLTLEEIYSLIKTAKGVIAHRSGIIEPLISANKNWHIIYSKSHTFENADVRKLYSLNKYPISNAVLAKEYMWTCNNDNTELINKIIGNLKKGEANEKY